MEIKKFISKSHNNIKLVSKVNKNSFYFATDKIKQIKIIFKCLTAKSQIIGYFSYNTLLINT